MTRPNNRADLQLRAHRQEVLLGPLHVRPANGTFGRSGATEAGQVPYPDAAECVYHLRIELGVALAL